MFKRVALVAVSALVAASFGIPAAGAMDGDNGTITLTVNKLALTNQFKTGITLSGTYRCSAPEGMGLGDITMSGINIGVQQMQRGSVVVSGGSGFGPLTCDGGTYTWSATDVWANSGGMGGGIPATWKGGKAIANVQANIGDGSCDDTGCGGQTWGNGVSVDMVIQIR